MTTSYSTLSCSNCGSTFPATQGKCGVCRPVTMEMVRAIAAEVFAEGHAASVQRLMSEKDALEQARTAALEEAACELEVWRDPKDRPIEQQAMAARIRALKPEKARGLDVTFNDAELYGSEYCTKELARLDSENRRLRRWLEWRNSQGSEGEPWFLGTGRNWIDAALSGEKAPE